jgi:DNA-binding response OmpR family regulator
MQWARDLFCLYLSVSLMEHGCDGFILKPFDMNELLEKIRRILT